MTRVVQSIEVAVKKGSPFQGRVLLAVAPEPDKPKQAEPEKPRPPEPEKAKANGSEPEKAKAPEPEKPKPPEPEKAKPAPRGPTLAYYWGGKCKGTDVPPSRLQLLAQAMKEGWAVEAQAFPIAYQGTVVMGMQSFAVSRP
jgi:hypothetical protein